jgi:MoaA/NifB/PqqE/SkfB family radical SAM enzyme
MTTKPVLITGRRARWIRSKLHLYIIARALKLYINPIRAFSELRSLISLRSKVHASIRISKFIRSGKRYFWNADYCGYPSENLKDLLKNEFYRNSKLKKPGFKKPVHLQTLIWGITNRCPLSCSHCYEWDNIAQTDSLDMAKLKDILGIFKTNGIRHIQFSGGEPMVRFNELVELVKEASTSMDCWLLTSGFSLTFKKACALQEAGLIGAHISLDHWEAKSHNAFRNNEKSYLMVIDAVRNCLDAGIMVGLSLCATREFVTKDNLMKYATLAKNTGVNFIRILEPRAVGKLANQQVGLDKQQVELLSGFAIRLNTHPQYKDFPIVTFFGYHQRKMGCFGAGNRYVYVDPNGDLHACPFCRGRMGNVLEEPFNTILERVKSAGCHLFEARP